MNRRCGVGRVADDVLSVEAEEVEVDTFLGYRRGWSPANWEVNAGMPLDEYFASRLVGFLRLTAHQNASILVNSNEPVRLCP